MDRNLEQIGYGESLDPGQQRADKHARCGYVVSMGDVRSIVLETCHDLNAQRPPASALEYLGV